VSKPVRILWFEDVGYLNEPVIDTPAGKFSLRQTVAFLVFGALSYFASLLFRDLMLKLIIGGAIFLFSVVVFTRRVKTVPPERHLLLLLGVGRQKIKSKAKTGRRKEKAAEPSKPSREMAVSGELGSPIKLIGILRDPSSGRLLSGREFEVRVDGEPYLSDVTDEQGFFQIFFVPERFGVFKVEVFPKGYADTVQELRVNVKSTGVVETVPVTQKP